MIVCFRCGGLGFYPVGQSPQVKVFDCDPCLAEIKKNTPKTILRKSKREIYTDAATFMDNEDRIQWEQDKKTYG